MKFIFLIGFLLAVVPWIAKKVAAAAPWSLALRLFTRSFRKP
jgi:hypothetical protein